MLKSAFSAKVRSVYDGSCVTVEDNGEIPSLLPRPLVVGMKVYARVRAPKDGIYTGTIDAVLDDGYRVVFEKEEMIPPMIIRVRKFLFEKSLHRELEKPGK